MANEVPVLTAFKGHTKQVNQMVKDTIIDYSSVLQVLPFIQITTGFSLTELEEVEGSGAGIQTRGLNEDYNNTSADFRERQYGVGFLGDALRIEKHVEQQLPGTVAKQMRVKLRMLARQVNNYFINGSRATSKKQFDGLKTICGDSGSMVIGTGSDITVNTSLTTMKTFLDRLDEAFRSINGEPNAIWMNDILYDAITSGARHLGADVLGTTTNFLGQQVTSYRGVPFLKLKNDQAGTAILPFTEALGGGSSQTSCYVTKMDRDEGLCGVSTRGITILPDEDNLFHRDVLDFSMGLRDVTNSIIRVARLKVA